MRQPPKGVSHAQWKTLTQGMSDDEVEAMYRQVSNPASMDVIEELAAMLKDVEKDTLTRLLAGCALAASANSVPGARELVCGWLNQLERVKLLEPS